MRFGRWVYPGYPPCQILTSSLVILEHPHRCAKIRVQFKFWIGPAKNLPRRPKLGHAIQSTVTLGYSIGLDPRRFGMHFRVFASQDKIQSKSRCIHSALKTTIGRALGTWHVPPYMPFPAKDRDKHHSSARETQIISDGWNPSLIDDVNPLRAAAPRDTILLLLQADFRGGSCSIT
jgi:hypothetical protein